MRAQPRERGHARGPLGHEHGLLQTEPGLDLLDPRAEEPLLVRQDRVDVLADRSERFAHRHDGPGWGEVDDAVGDAHADRVVDRDGRRRDELLGVATHAFAAPSSVPLEHRELGLVVRAELIASEAPTDLVDVAGAARDEPLHLVLGAGDQPPIVARRERIEMQVHAGRGHAQRRLDLEESLAVEVVADRAQHASARAQSFEPSVP